MIQLDPAKSAKLHNTNELLDRKYGKKGTDTRTAFEEKALSHYYGEILGERKKELCSTDEQR